MKIAISTIVFNKRSIKEAIELAKDIGYDGVEIWGSKPHISYDTPIERVRDIRNMLEFYELEVPNIASYVGNFSTISDEECNIEYEKLYNYMDIMEILKCDMIRVWIGGPNTFLANSYHYEKAMFWIDKCADIAEKNNKRIALEIHNGSLIETVESANRFIKDLNRNNVGLIHDAGNMYITDTDYGGESIEVLGDSIFHVHIKDELRVDSDSLMGAFRDRTIYGDEIFQHKLLGQGAVDHFPVFKALIKQKYKGFVSAESLVPIDDIKKAQHELNEIKEQIRAANIA